MSLIGYENVRPWLRSIAKKVVAREMPPWSADPSRSVKFQNDPTLSQAEIDVITRWIDAGAAERRRSRSRPAGRRGRMEGRLGPRARLCR